MRLHNLLCAVTADIVADAIGFTSYKEIVEGSDNSGAIAYNELDRSTTNFLYIQIVAGSDHSEIIK
jgi:hypothetical protein